MAHSLEERPQVLLVGAGAVGQIYSYYLAKAGADVTFFAKPQHADAARGGFWLYRIPGFRLSGKGELRAPIRVEACQVLTRLDEVAAKRWDLIFLCVSSPALRSGWFPEFARAVGSEATFVLFQLGLDDREYAAAHVAPERLVSGCFTKVGDQIAAALETNARLAREHSLPADAIEVLQARRHAALRQ